MRVRGGRMVYYYCAARNLKKSAFEEQKREMRKKRKKREKSKKAEKTRATRGEEKEEEEEKPFSSGLAIKKRWFTPCCDEGIAETRP